VAEQLVDLLHVPRVARERVVGEPGDVHLDALPAERAHHGEEGALLLAEDEDLGRAHALALTRAAGADVPRMSSKSCCMAATWWRMSNTASTRVRAARPMAARRAGSSSSVPSASASAAASRGGT